MVVGKSQLTTSGKYKFVAGKGYVSKSTPTTSSSKTSSKSSGGSSSSSDPRLAVSRVPISGGAREYNIGGQWVSQTEYNKTLETAKKKRSSGSFSRSGSLSTKGQIITTSFTDTGTGQTTTKTFQGTGTGSRLVSTRTTSPTQSLQQARQIQLDLQRKRLLQQQLKQQQQQQLQQLQKIEIKPSETQQQLQRQTITQTQLETQGQPVSKSIVSDRKVSFAFLTESQKQKLGLTGDKYKNIAYDPFTGQYRKIDKNGIYGEVVKTASQKDEEKIFLNPSQFFAKTGESIGADLIGGIRRGEVTPSSIGKGLASAVKNPDAVLQGMVESAATNPFGFVGELYAGDKLTKAALTPIKATGKGLSKLAFSKDPIPDLKLKIQTLEKAKVKKGTPQFDELQLLKNQLAIYTDLKFKTAPKLTEIRTKVASKIAEGKNTKLASKKSKLLQDIAKETKKADKIIQDFKIRTRIKVNQAKALRKKYAKGVTQLKPETISAKLGEFFKVGSASKKLSESLKKKLPETQIKQYIKQKQNLINRISKLENRLRKPNIAEQSSKRIKSELEFLKNSKKKIDDLLNQDLFKLEKLTLKERKKFFDKAKEAQQDLKVFSEFREEIIKLEKKFKNAIEIKDLNKIPKQFQKATKVYRIAQNYQKLSKAQRGQLLKQLKDINKKSISPKVLKEIEPIKKITSKDINKQSLSKQEVDSILSRTNKKSDLQARIKNYDKRINTLKSYKNSLTPKQQVSLNKRINLLEKAKRDLIDKSKKPSQSLNQKQILERSKKIKSDLNKIQVSPKVIDSPRGVKRFRVGEFEIEFDFNSFRRGSIKGKRGAVNVPQFVKVRKLKSSKISSKSLKKYKDDLNKASKPHLNKARINYNKANNIANRIEKQIKNPKLTNKQKINLRRRFKQIDSLRKSNLFRLGKAIRVAVSFANAQAIRQDLKDLNLSSQDQAFKQIQTDLIKDKQQLEEVLKDLNKIETEINKIPDPKIPEPKPPVPKPPKPKIPEPKPPVPPKPRIPKPRKPEPPEKPKLPLPKIRFDSPQLKNRVIKIEAYLRERRNPDKPFGKNNIRVTKKSFSGTRNRIINKLNDLVDRKLIRSWEPVVIGVGKNLKDVPLNKRLNNKFRKKKGTTQGVKRRVEKSKFALDNPSERKELKTLKTKKKQSGTKPRPKTKTRRIKTNSKPNKTTVRQVKKTSNVKRAKPSRSTKKSNKTTKRRK